ncbi:MAG: response regulator [Bacteroidales bacterium]|nr:response regulator [Bacteroidales bacterium]
MIIINFIHNSIFLIFLGLAIYVLIKNKKALLNQMIFGLLLFFSLWSLALSFIENPLANKTTAEFFVHIGNLAGIGYGIFAFLSICAFTKLIKLNKIVYILLAVYFTSVLIFQITTNFASITIKNNLDLWVVEYNNNQIYLLVSLIHNSLIFSGFILLVKFIRGNIDFIQKKQAGIILITAIISFILSSINIFIPKLFPQIQMPLLVDLCMMVFAVGFVYSIIKYELFEITPKMFVNQIIDILPAGLLIADTKNQIIRFNKSLLEITERSKNDFEKKQIKGIIQSLSGHEFDFENKSDFNIQVNILISKQEPKPVVLFFKKVIDKHNRLIGSIILIQDIEQLISSQKQLEELNQSLENRIEERTIELKSAKEKAEESDRLKTAFLQNMSHEIRTPLNAICGFSGMLNMPKITDEKRDTFVSIIQNSSNQLLSIVTDILTISSLETKQEKLNISKVNINEIIVDLLTIFKTQAQNKNISLYSKQQLNDKQSEIYTDKTKITQILSNLLSNALKFTHEGFIEFGYTILETRHGVSQHHDLQFYLKDTGIGIKPELHEKIFERFRQADKSIQMNFGGTGLGLSISKGFAELLGGKIWVESEPEKGSTFYFTIPYEPVNEIDKTTSPTKQNENFRTVLVAEDEEYNFLFIEELLIDLDLKLIHAKDGQETVEIFKTNPKIDLILMDIKMPIMNGHEAAKIIKKLKPDLPIIAQSAYALEHERAKFEEIFDDYLTKPINEKDLIEIVTKYI